MLNRKMFVFCALLVALVGCHPVKRMNSTMSSWMGASSTQLLSKWGPPSSTMKDQDMDVWIYSSTTKETTKSPEVVVNAGTRNKPVPVIIGGNTTTVETMDYYRMFWVRNGRIVNWSWKGF